MSSAVVIPTALLNMRAHAIIDIALGVIVFVFQVFCQRPNESST